MRRFGAGGSGEALSRTLARRPDLLDGAALDEEEQQILRELQAEAGIVR